MVINKSIRKNGGLQAPAPAICTTATPIGKLNPLEEYRFLSKIKENKNGCWIWTAGRNGEGYGYIKIRKRHLRAPRVSYTHFIGTIPFGKIVCHKCDDRACVNPDHLFLGLYADNTRDMFKKGRNQSLKGTTKPYLFGSLNHKSKLTIKDVLHIREVYKKGCKKFGSGALARKFGVTDIAVLNVVKRKVWKHV